MRQSKRQVTDKATICAMLDAIDTIHVAMHDEPVSLCRAAEFRL